MVDLDIPCPQCAEKLVLDESTAGQRVVCPACDALISMPALPSGMKAPVAKPSLPATRPDGEQPRTHAIDTGLAFTPAPAPATAPAAPLVRKATAPSSPERHRAILPAGRKSDRPLPDLTPAPYNQPEMLTAPPTPAAHAIRAELPAPRAAHEVSRLHPPLDLEEPAANPAPAAPAVVVAPPAPEPETTPRPGNHPLGTARKLQFLPQGSISVDPEIKDAWGLAGDDPEARQTRGRRLILWAALIAVPLLIGVLWQTLGRRHAANPDAAANRVPSTAGAAEDVRQASEAVRKFLATTTIEERIRWVRHPEVTKDRMQAWHTPANPLKPLKVLRFHDRSSEQTIDGATFLLLYMELDDFSTRAVGVERTEDGYKVDWESFSFWSALPWGEFLSKQPAEPAEFRVTVEIDDYYNFGYSDRAKLFCYKLTDPENWAHCWGYCGIDSEVGMQINRMIRRQRQVGMNVIKAILRLRFKPEPEARGHNQVFIESVVQDGWVTAKP